ncbi:MAG: Holliday junction branch migration protein RuvA [Candidatus Moraniibacteriota bacterium]
MIGKIRGKIESIKENYVIIDVHDIGYKIQMNSYSLAKIAGQESVELFIYTHVREDVLALYGFIAEEEQEMFELLISISGIGPKAASSILAIASPKTIKAAIVNEDPSILTKVSGIGKKTAGRVILELKNKVGAISQGDQDETTGDSNAIEALIAMGYSAYEAREALKSVSGDIKDIGKRVGMALRNIGKK